MPFTLSHAAAVLPLRRLRPVRTLPLSALVIGSFVPDFGWLMQGLVSRSFSHSWAGWLLFCLPVGWLSYLLFRHVLRAPLCALFARPLERLLLVTLASEARGVVPVSAALLLGAATHILWDGFTHADGMAVALFPLLTDSVALSGGQSMRAYALLQHLSSLVGLALLALHISAWIHRGSGVELQQALRRTLWRSALLLLPLAAAMIELGSWLGPTRMDHAAAAAAAQAMKWGAAGLCVYAIGWHCLQQLPLRRTRRQP